MKGEAGNVTEFRPQTREDSVFQLRNLADLLEQGSVDPEDVAVVVDEPEGLFLCGMDLRRVLLRVWRHVQHDLLSLFQGTEAVLIVKAFRREPVPNPNLILEG